MDKMEDPQVIAANALHSLHQTQVHEPDPSSTVELSCTAKDLDDAMRQLEAQAKRWFGDRDYTIKITGARTGDQAVDVDGTVTCLNFEVHADATWTPRWTGPEQS